MRAVVRCVLAVIGIAASVVAGPAGVSLAAANQSHGFAIASVLPARGEVVGVAHPVVVTFSAPVANRRAAERAIEVKSAPAMTGKFEWLRQRRRAVGSRPILAGAQHGGAFGGRPVHELCNGSRRRRCCQYLGSHVHREHRRRRRGTAVCATGAAPPTPLGRSGRVPGLDG